jgi:chaperonin GroEL
MYGLSSSQVIFSAWVTLKKGSKKVSTNAEIAQIGTISANDDREIGEMIAQAMHKVGNETIMLILVD